MKTKGQLTQEMIDVAKPLLGFDITREHIRLFSSIIQNQLSSHNIGNYIGLSDLTELKKLCNTGMFQLVDDFLRINEDGWNLICKIIYMSHVDPVVIDNITNENIHDAITTSY